MAMPPVRRDCDMDEHNYNRRPHSRRNSLQPPTDGTTESGIESGPESGVSSPRSSLSSMRSKPEGQQVHYGLTHEDNCGCPAADLQGIVIVQLENENRQLRTRLDQSERTMTEMSRQMELQKTRTRQLIAGWKLKLQENEDKMVKHSKDKDTQLAGLLSQLMYFEGCLKKEREQITEDIHSKDARIDELMRTVKHQKKQINALNRANERLLTSLHDTMNRTNGHDSESTSSSEDDESSASSRNSPVPILARRKASMPAAVSFAKITNGNASSDNISASSAPRQRKSAAMNGPNPIIHNVHVDSNDTSPNHQLSSDSTSPESPRRRVRFDPRVQNNNIGEDSDSENERRQKVRLRKISLPAYRLPTDEEGSIRYF